MWTVSNAEYHYVILFSMKYMAVCLACLWGFVTVWWTDHGVPHLWPDDSWDRLPGQGEVGTEKVCIEQ